MTREEFYDLVYSELESDTTTNRANRIIDAAESIDENQNGCGWCKANRCGEYEMAAFVNPENAAQGSTLSFYGGKAVMEATITKGSKPARMSVSINFCPMCGRRFTEGK